MRYEHIFTYDQDEHEKSFLYDKPAERIGLEAAVRIINIEINRILKGKVIESINVIDKLLLDFYQSKGEGEIGTNVIKSVSEAVLFATASCFEKIKISKGISDKACKGEFGMRKTKLMINLLNGGKILGSAVKFAKFYLIIDGNENSNGEVDIGECFIKFVQNFRKTI